MSVLVLVFDDGRLDYLERTVESFREHVQGDEFHLIVHQDEPADQARTRALLPDCEVIGGDQRSGFAGAIRRAWAHAAQPQFDRFDFVFHLEGDFTFNRKVNVQLLQITLDSHPELAQMAFRRQPWNQAERDAGGVVELNPQAFKQITNAFGWSWLHHRLFFTTNPSLYRRDLLSARWPSQAKSEGLFTAKLRDRGLPWGVPGPMVEFGYWGHRDDPPWVEHIGHVRAGSGY